MSHIRKIANRKLAEYARKKRELTAELKRLKRLQAKENKA